MNERPIEILMVEDNPGDAALLRRNLAESPSASFNLDHAERLDEATEKLDQQRYDLVLLDLELADSHGLDTFATLRDKASRVPIVVVTGLDDEELGVQAIQLGAQDYLVKGQFASRDLVRAVRYATERQRRDRQTEAVHRLREEIWRMRSSRDIDGVIAALKDILEMLDLSLHRCRVAVVDQAGDSPTVWVHDMSQNGKWEEAPTTSVDKLMQVWRGEKPVFRPDLPEEVKSDEEVRCALDLPFSQGVLTLTSALADAYSEQDIASFEPLVETLEEAFIRMKDMQVIEARNHQLEGANEELTHFAYVASHDLQEPLRMVSSYLTLIKRRYEGQLDADADEFIGFAVDGATRMSKMIEGLLTYSRIRTRGGEFTETSSADVFAQVVTGRQHEIDVVGGKVSHASLPRIVADERQFAMLLDHLLDNAIRFRSEAPRIHLEAERSMDEWTFSMRDNGIGVRVEDYSRIFQVFQRATPDGDERNTGIGLAVCKSIVQRHGGEIWVESEQDQGATFCFTIPTA